MLDGTLEETSLQWSERTVDPRERLIVALDLPSRAGAIELLQRLGMRCRWVKVGMELFYAAGREFVHELRTQGYQVFLDLKLHDIPNTVAAGVRSLSELDVQITTVHAAGGPAMLEAAATAAKTRPVAPLLAAVTVLTSVNGAELAATGISVQPGEQVMRLAHLAVTSGLRALVCSPLEVARLRRELGPEVVLIVPGVRPAGVAAGDQSRIATPRQAILDGASLLVVGRPITHAADPVAATETILSEIASAAEELTRSAGQSR